MTTTPTSPSPDALLPCDWCGEVPVPYDVRGPEDEGYFAIECRSKKCRDAGRFCGVHADDEEEAREAWNTRTHASAPTGQAGWQLVPKEPTFEMQEAAADAYETGGSKRESRMYKAMLAAAPKPESP